MTANAIAPAARTRMTEAVFAETWPRPTRASTRWRPRTSRRSSCGSAAPTRGDVTGRVFEVEGGILSVADGWQHGPKVDKGRRWEPAEVSKTNEPSTTKKKNEAAYC